MVVKKKSGAAVSRETVAGKKTVTGKTVAGTRKSVTRKVVKPEVSDTDKIKVIAAAMLEKKAGNVISMDLRGSMGASFDHFVICDATSGPQVRAIADEIQERFFKEFKEYPLHEEGYANAEWILLDYGGVVAHIFLEEVRQHYRLEELWGDAQLNYYKEEDFN